MKTNDEKLLERLLRRLAAPRGAVFLEFALIAPLAFMLVLFAADFCRILQAEQQIEIAARAVADIEIHYRHTKDDDGTDQATPFRKTKECVANYLQATLGHPENTWTLTRVEISNVPNVFYGIKKLIDKITFGDVDSWIGKLIHAIFKEIANIFLGGTQYYFDNLAECDRMLKAACAVKYKTLFPGSAYAFYSQFLDGYLYVAPTQYKLNGNKFDYRKRELHYCAMPILETLEEPPVTWIRKAEKNLSKSFIVGLMKKLGLNFSDYKKEVDE